MPARVSTATVGRWREVISETFVELTPAAVDVDRFRGVLDTRERGGLSVSVISGSSQTVQRGAAEIRRSPGRDLFFLYHVAGTGRVEHDGGGLDLRVGDCALVHPDRPYVLGFDQAFRQVCVQVPDWRLKAREGSAVEAAYGRPLAATPAVAQVLRAATLALLRDDAPDALAAEMFLDVLARSFHAPDPRSATDAQLRRFVAENFRLEGLSPADAAAELGCSVRNVHKVCQGLGTSFGRMLLEARLGAAGRSLARGGATPSRVTDVAYDCGFADLSHFSRTFKAHFGVSPRRYRHHA